MMSFRIDGNNPVEKAKGTSAASAGQRTDTTSQNLQKGLQQKANQLSDIPDIELGIIKEIVEDKLAELNAKLQLANQNQDVAKANSLKAEIKKVQEELDKIEAEVGFRKYKDTPDPEITIMKEVIEEQLAEAKAKFQVARQNRNSAQAETLKAKISSLEAELSYVNRAIEYQKQPKLNTKG